MAKDLPKMKVEGCDKFVTILKQPSTKFETKITQKTEGKNGAEDLKIE